MKRCNRCKEFKDYAKFQVDRSKKDGHHSICKDCVRLYKQSPEVRATAKAREQLTRTRATRLAYRLSDRGKEVQKQSYTRLKENVYQKQIERHNRDPRKRKAKAKITSEIRAGRMKKAREFFCSCGRQARDYHHYNGYEPEHWLDVIPLCRQCHANIHKEMAQ